MPTNRSQHPTDRLVRELIQTGRSASKPEIQQILSRVAGAAFDPRVIPVPLDERGVTYLGRTLGSRERSAFVHLVRRVVVDEEWAVGTTESEYVDDLRNTARAPSARLALYERRGGYLVLVMAPNTVDPSRIGPLAKRWICTMYSADRGILVSGYQSDDIPVGVPSGARWLT